ncbi:DNA polymerase III subunit gamma/tau [Planktothrix tepida]|uniref:DNA-directed DNA polymerase n=1 Tax=Planktothrix tepida PCC 9214 TaxID=671072 RepID=A0A1J1LE59_9CYAN|nr:DNA polymerase III subunit gamma/tau [Planktothrix tepida]CAD5919733.1 DNA polymerase III subunit gamma/tau [Planktothrix tepida]CUR30871.1 DNA polymerase III subunits gamma and tau [Planktothrix tepida PCC 9214]
MSYEPLHHKYRPQTFAHLVGQEAIATTLTNAIESQRIAPAYLFTGPRGTGKTSSARILAKSLNCLATGKPTATPCGVCDVCKGITNGSTLDVIEIDAASNTGVDNIRELIERSQFAPVQCRYKVYVIDECLTGDSLVQTRDGLIRIDQPQLKGKEVLSYNEDQEIWEYKKVLRWLDQGERSTLIIKTNNCEIRCTDNHLLRTETGWIQAKNVREGMKILSPVNVGVERSLNSIQSRQWNTSLETVVSVQVGEITKVYDIEVEDHHNFVANGLLVHNCHMLSTAAFNALLKTLEEPPDRVVFVLATTDPQRVLATIISRCQRFDFRRIPLDSMVKHLQYIAQQENINIASDAIFMVAQIAQGGLRDAESLLDQLSLLSGEITVEKVWDLVGAVPERDLISLLEAINSGDTAIILDCIRQLLNRGREPLIVLQNLAGFYRDLLIAKSAPDRPDLVALTQPTWEKLCQFSQHWDHTIILAGQKHLRESEAQIKHTTQPRLWLEITLLGLLPAALQKSVVTQTVSVVQNPQTTVQTPPQYVQRSEPSPPPQNPVNVPVYQPTSNPEPQPQVKSEIPATPAEPPVVIDGNIEQIWQQVLAYVQPFGTQQMFRQQGRLIQYNAGVAMIKMASSTLLKMAQTKQKLSSLEKAFQQVFGHPVKINFDTGGGTSAYRVQEVTPPSPSYSPVENSKVSSPEISPNSSINHQEQHQISSSPDQDIRESDQIDQVKPEMETGKMPVPLEKVELTPEEMDAEAVMMASQKLAEFFKGQMIDLGEKQTSKTAILLSQKDDIIDSSEDDNFIEPDEIEEDNYDDF